MKKIKLPLTPKGNVDKRSKEYRAGVVQQLKDAESCEEAYSRAVEALATHRERKARGEDVTVGGTSITGRTYAARDTEPKATSVLDTAKEIIYGDREAVYGDPAKNLRCISDMWQTYLFHKYGAGFPLDVNDVCAFMRLVKEARLINSPNHIDSLVDIAGYSALQERVMK